MKYADMTIEEARSLDMTAEDLEWMQYQESIKDEFGKEEFVCARCGCDECACGEVELPCTVCGDPCVAQDGVCDKCIEEMMKIPF